MRRKDREVSNFDGIVAILERSSVVRIAMNDGDAPYILPMNFGYTVSDRGLTLFMHSAAEGKKIDIIKACPDVGFEADSFGEIITGKSPCDWSASFESVIGKGKIELADNELDKREGLDAIMRHYGYVGAPEYSEAMLKHTCVLRLTVEDISGKKR